MAVGGASGNMLPHGGVNDVGVADFVISFEANNGSALDDTKVRGKHVSSIVRDDTGEHTVTLTGDVYQLVYMQAEPAGVSGADAARATCYLNGSDGELQSPLSFKVYTCSSGSTKADLAAGRRVYVHLKARLSNGG